MKRINNAFGIYTRTRFYKPIDPEQYKSKDIRARIAYNSFRIPSRAEWSWRARCERIFSLSNGAGPLYTELVRRVRRQELTFVSSRINPRERERKKDFFKRN